jgi:ribonuclease J
MAALKFIALSGTTGVTQNHYVYEYGSDIIVVDAGVGFPEAEMYGVDLVIPDFSYIKENRNKLRAVLISHGHEDHLGALPFLLSKVNVPVYATRLVAGFIEDKLAEYGIKGAKINVFNPERDTLTFGSFRVTPFRVSHSVPDGVGFAIDTPEGRVFHVADYKFDWTPVDAKPFDVAKAANLAAEGTLALASDCLGANSPGQTESEAQIEERIENLMTGPRGQIFFTTISSNISRVQQALHVAERIGRKVAIIGRSIDKKVQIARKLGYLHYHHGQVISAKEAVRLPPEKRLFVISGSYGQPGSALYRLALGEHDLLKINPNDLVIFSSDPAPPGSKANVDFLVDKLIEADTDVHYYDMQEDLHVSGHGSQKDIEMLFALLKPKYFIPIGGTIRHMRAYAQMAQRMGAKKEEVLELMPGEIVEFSGKAARKAGKLPVKDVLVDGLGIGDVGNVVLRDRQILAQDGVAIAMLQIDRNARKLLDVPEIISRGFVYEAKHKEILIRAAEELSADLHKKEKVDPHMARVAAVDFLEKFFFEKTGRRPMVIPVIVEV